MIDSKGPIFANISIHAGYSLFCRGFRRVSGRFSEEKGRRDANAAGSSRREGGLRVDHGMIVRREGEILCKQGVEIFRTGIGCGISELGDLRAGGEGRGGLTGREKAGQGSWP